MKIMPSALRLFCSRSTKVMRSGKAATRVRGGLELRRSDAVVAFGALLSPLGGFLRRLRPACRLGHHVLHDEVGERPRRRVPQLAGIAGGPEVLDRIPIRRVL